MNVGDWVRAVMPYTSDRSDAPQPGDIGKIIKLSGSAYCVRFIMHPRPREEMDPTYPENTWLMLSGEVEPLTPP